LLDSLLQENDKINILPPHGAQGSRVKSKNIRT